MRRMDDLLQGFVAQHRMKLQAQPTSLATKSARNLPSPGDFVAGFYRFWSLTHQLISFVIECFLPTSRDKYHHS